MDVNHNIKLLLGHLMATNKLMTWQICQERSWNALVKIRFGSHENGGPGGPTDDIQNSNTFFKRKSDKQVKRDDEKILAFIFGLKTFRNVRLPSECNMIIHQLVINEPD